MTIVADLAKILNKSEFEVFNFLLDAPKKYKVYNIPKRKVGYRVIAQPSKELKIYQRAFINMLAASLPIHNAAKAYRKGIGIKDNALMHSKHSYLLKMDFENFFNSINRDLFWKVWSAVIRIDLTIDDKRTIENLIFWQPNKKNRNKLVLSIGAPASPLISNFVMHQFDSLVYEHCRNLGITYSRYADDITFSTNEKGLLFDVPLMIKETLKNFFGQRLTLNHSKTVFSSKAHNRHVTGVTISNDGQLSLGRERKRYIKHLVHQYILGISSLEDVKFLNGMLSFSHYIEPSFIQTLKSKYPQLDFTKLLEVSHEQKQNK